MRGGILLRTRMKSKRVVKKTLRAVEKEKDTSSVEHIKWDSVMDERLAVRLVGN